MARSHEAQTCRRSPSSSLRPTNSCERVGLVRKAITDALEAIGVIGAQGQTCIRQQVVKFHRNTPEMVGKVIDADRQLGTVTDDGLLSAVQRIQLASFDIELDVCGARVTQSI